MTEIIAKIGSLGIAILAFSAILIALLGGSPLVVTPFFEPLIIAVIIAAVPVALVAALRA